MGYLLFSERSGKAFVLLYGEGNDGKSTLCEFLERIYKPSGIVVPSTISQAFSTHAAAYYSNARLLILGECNSTFTQSQVDCIKRFTGRDGIPLNTKHGAISHGHLDIKILGACNHLPSFKTGCIDEALKSRIQPIRMYSVPKEHQNADQVDLLLKDASYFIQEAIEGFARLQKNHYVFTNCKKDDHLRSQIFDANPAQQFVDDVCEIGCKYELKSSELKEAFLNWKDREGVDCNYREFCTALQNLGYPQRRFNHGVGNNFRGFKGLRLKQFGT